jgi:hypothetical protein
MKNRSVLLLAIASFLLVAATIIYTYSISIDGRGGTLSHHEATFSTPKYDTIPPFSVTTRISEIGEWNGYRVVMKINGILYSEWGYSHSSAPVDDTRVFTLSPGSKSCIIPHSDGGYTVTVYLKYYMPGTGSPTDVTADNYEWKHPTTNRNHQ